MKQETWVFDFDKTLTRTDTTLPLLLFGSSTLSGIIRRFHYYLLAVAVKLHIISHLQLKNVLLSVYFGGWTPERWTNHCLQCAQSIGFSGLYHSIDWKDAGKRYCIVSASPEALVASCFPSEVKILATTIRFNNNKLAGIAQHMHGRTKKQALTANGFAQADRFYSDHYYDTSVASLAAQVFHADGDMQVRCDDVAGFYHRAGGPPPSFSITACPPAQTSFSILKVITGMSKANILEQEMASYLGADLVFIGDAWVNVLAEGLRCLPGMETKQEVILPVYSCNEFTKAILLAGLKPVYAPLDDSCRLAVGSVEKYITENTLAVLSVNNTGVASDLSALREFCENHSVWMLEDAGYTFLGSDMDGRPYGSFGHAAVINMSEGKTIPCGGAAWAVNDKRLTTAFETLAHKISTAAPRSDAAELLSLLIYKTGASTPGFTLYRLLRSMTSTDLKNLFSSEPSRQAEHYESGNLQLEDGIIKMDAGHEAQLKAITIRPWNNARKSAARLIMLQAESIRNRRNRNLQLWKAALEGSVRLLELPDNAMPVKQPFLLPQGLFSKTEIGKLAWQGIKKQYPPSWPMAGIRAAHDQLFYGQAYTLPLHTALSRRRIRKLAAIIKTRV